MLFSQLWTEFDVFCKLNNEDPITFPESYTNYTCVPTRVPCMAITQVAIPLTCVPHVAIPHEAIPLVAHNKLHKTCMFHAMRKCGPHKHITDYLKLYHVATHVQNN